MNKKRISFLLLLIICSTLFSWMWFVPVFWELSDGETDFWLAFQKVFFQSNKKEFFLGDTTDLQGTIWVFHSIDQIIQGNATTILPHLYSPIGFDWGLNEGFAWLDAVLGWPYYKMIGTLGFYNFHVFVLLAGNAFFLTLMFSQTKIGFLPAFSLSMIALLHPFAQHEIFHGRPTQMHLWFQALFLLSIYKLLYEEAKIRWSIIGGLSLAGACLVYWFGAAALGFVGAIAFVLAWFEKRSSKTLKGGLLLAGLGMGICLWVTWRISVLYLTGQSEGLFPHLEEKSWVMWNVLGREIPLSTVLHYSSFEDITREIRFALFPRKIFWLLGLAVILPFGWKKRLPWIIASLVAITLPLPLAINFGEIWIPSGQALLHWIFPPLERLGFPSRLMTASMLMIPFTIAIGLGEIMKKLPTWKTKVPFQLIISGIFLSWAFQYLPQNVPISSLQADNDVIQMTKKYPGGLIHVPVEGSGNAFVQQIFHGQPILSGPGFDTVRSTDHKEYCADNSLLRALELLGKEKHSLQPVFEEKDRQQLLDDGFRLVQIDLRQSKSRAESYQLLLGTEGLNLPQRHLLILPLTLEIETEAKGNTLLK